MSRFLDIALRHAALGLYVFPVSRTKGTITDHGYKDASIDPETIRAWWAKHPSANPGFAPGASGVAVLDVDHGFTCLEDFIAWRDRNGVPATYTVRSGSRPEFKVHLYFRGAIPDVGKWELDGCSGQVKSLGGYVLAAGSEALHGKNHDQPGAPYEVIDGTLGAFADTPDVVRQLRKPAAAPSNNSKVRKTAWSLPVYPGENRTGFLLEQCGELRNLGCGKDAIHARMIELNEDPEIIAEAVDPDRLETTAENCSRMNIREIEPIAVLGGEPTEKHWREHYHTLTEHENVGPPRFLIEGFLPEQAIMGIGAFVGQKKTLAALNIVHSLCSGEPLFSRYKVARKPARVLYLGPENGLMSFSNRVNRIGLRDYLCKTFFYSTMSMEDQRPLSALTSEEVEDAAIVIDTAIRFTNGSENDAAMMKEFAEHAFSLIRNKAACVIMLHHSPKSMTQSNELTLENSFRGTGELAAFLSVALAMRTQDMHHEYESPSLLRFVKQRDFEPRPSSFEVKTDRETCRMTFVDGSDGATVQLGEVADKDGKEEAAIALMSLATNRQLSNVNMAKLLKDAGIRRSKEWVRIKRGELGLGGIQVSSGNGKPPYIRP